VLWATGFRPDHSWLHIPVHDHTGHIRHDGGLVTGAPGLYVLGLPVLRTRALHLYPWRSRRLPGPGRPPAFLPQQPMPIETRRRRGYRLPPTLEVAAPAAGSCRIHNPQHQSAVIVMPGRLAQLRAAGGDDAVQLARFLRLAQVWGIS
jgi:hypothetical protein